MRTEKEKMEMVVVVIIAGLVGGCVSLLVRLAAELGMPFPQYDLIGMNVGKVAGQLAVFWFTLMGVGVIAFLSLVYTRRHDSLIKNLVRHFQKDRIIDTMLERDIRYMEKAKTGRTYFIYFNEEMKPRKGLIFFKVKDGELIMKVIRSHPVPYTKGGRLISIWGKAENRIGYVTHYTNPAQQD